MIAGRKELSKFIDWAADIKFADFSVWGHARLALTSGGDGLGGKMDSLYFISPVGLAVKPPNQQDKQTEQECEP